MTWGCLNGRHYVVEDAREGQLTRELQPDAKATVLSWLAHGFGVAECDEAVKEAAIRDSRSPRLSRLVKYLKGRLIPSQEHTQTWWNPTTPPWPDV